MTTGHACTGEMLRERDPMNWTDVLKDRASAVLRERTAPGRRIFSNAQPNGWDPYEVWLTRVKQPRDRAADTARKDAP